MVNQQILPAHATNTVRRNLWPICVAMLILSNGVLIWKTRQLSGALNRVNPSVRIAGVEQMMMKSFQSSQGGTTMLHHSCGRYLALFVFTRYDGPFYSDEALGLNQIVRDRPDIAVFGLMAYGAPDDVREFVSQQRIFYPVLVDTDGSAVRGLDLPRIPSNFIFDCSQQRILYQGPSVANGNEGQDFLTKLLSLEKR
jgi:hypothetical protein